MKMDFNKKGFFNDLIGNWEGIANTWFKPNDLADTSNIKGNITLVLDGLFLLHQYEGSLLGEKMKGLAIYGYSKPKNQFEMAWINNLHQGSEIMFSKSKNIGNNFSVLGSYTSSNQEEVWGWRTKIELKHNNNLIISHFNISPDGVEYLGVQIDYFKKI